MSSIALDILSSPAHQGISTITARMLAEVRSGSLARSPKKPKIRIFSPNRRITISRETSKKNIGLSSQGRELKFLFWSLMKRLRKLKHLLPSLTTSIQFLRPMSWQRKLTIASCPRTYTHIHNWMNANICTNFNNAYIHFNEPLKMGSIRNQMPRWVVVNTALCSQFHVATPHLKRTDSLERLAFMCFNVPMIHSGGKSFSFPLRIILKIGRLSFRWACFPWHREPQDPGHSPCAVGP